MLIRRRRKHDVITCSYVHIHNCKLGSTVLCRTVTNVFQSSSDFVGDDQTLEKQGKRALLHIDTFHMYWCSQISFYLFTCFPDDHVCSFIKGFSIKKGQPQTKNCISLTSIMLQLLRSHLQLSAVLPSARRSLLRAYLTNSINSHRNVLDVQQDHLQMTLQQKTHLQRQYSTRTALADFVQHDSNGNVIIIISFYF